MKLKSIHLYIILLSFFTLGLSGKQTLTLDQCIEIALKKNPGIQSYRERHRAAKARFIQARALPQPEVGMDFDLQPRLFDLSGSQEQYIGISQLIEFPGKRGLRKRVAGKDVEASLCELKEYKLELEFQVKCAFYRLLQAGEQKKYARENLDYTLEFKEKAREKYEAGDVSKLEVLRAGVEVALAETQNKMSLSAIKLMEAELFYWLAGHENRSIGIVGALRPQVRELNIETFVEKALLFRPEVKKAGLELEKEKLSKKMAVLNYLPDLSLGLSQHRILGEQSTWDVTIGFTLPLFFWQNQKGEVAEAKANISTREAEFKQMKMSVSLAVRSAYYKAVNYRNQSMYMEEDVLREANQVYDISALSYREGKIGGLELIEARKTLLEIKQSYSESLLQYQLALAELEKCVGEKIQGGESE